MSLIQLNPLVYNPDLDLPVPSDEIPEDKRILLLLFDESSQQAYLELLLTVYFHTFLSIEPVALVIVSPLDVSENVMSFIEQNGLDADSLPDLVLVQFDRTTQPLNEMFPALLKATHLYLHCSHHAVTLPYLFAALLMNCCVALPTTKMFPTTLLAPELFFNYETATPESVSLYLKQALQQPPSPSRIPMLNFLGYSELAQGWTQLQIKSSIQHLQAQILNGFSPDKELLTSLLCLPQPEDRLQVNVALGQAYAHFGLYHNSFDFYQRAWLLSNQDEQLLSDYTYVLGQCKDFRRLENVYRSLGLKYLRMGHMDMALHYFQQCYTVYHQFNCSDKFDFHPEIAEALAAYTAPLRLQPVLADPFTEERRIRIAYLVHDICEPVSVLMKVNYELFKHHDYSLFDVYCVVHQPYHILEHNAHAMNMVSQIESFGAKVIFAPDIASQAEKFKAMAHQIHALNIDILLFNLQFAFIHMYYLATYNPAPIMIALIYGTPYMFSSALMDWNIGWIKPVTVDGIGPSSLISAGMDLSEIDSTPVCTRQQLDIPADQLVLMTIGRPLKYNCKEYFQAILDLLVLYPKAHYYIIGTTQPQISFWDDFATHEATNRVHFLGWISKRDTFSFLGVVDIYIDTYPTGGGFSMAEAMFLSIPCVSFQDRDVSKLFDPSDWNPGYDMFQIPELMAERGNFKDFQLIVAQLIEQPDMRTELGKLSRLKIVTHRSNPAKMTQDCEQNYLQVLLRKLGCLVN